MQERDRGGRRAFAWALLGFAAFTVYGSLVPFHFRTISFPDAIQKFGDTLAGGLRVASRSDALANVMLGGPIGFFLLGLVCVDRSWSRAKTARFGLLLVPVCVLFAMGVEFSQLFTKWRICSVSDMVAQPTGSALGMLAWVLFGQSLTERVRAIWARADVNAAGRMLLAYVVFVAFVQTLPFDVSASPYALYHKFKDGGVRFVPFGDVKNLSEADQWKQIAKLAKIAALYFPVGLLAARLKGRVEQWSIAHVALAALALGVMMEVPQLAVESRSPSSTDAIVGALAAVAGWYAARVHHEGLALPFAVSWGVVWLAGMTAITQPPPGTPRLEAPRAFDWIPGFVLESGNPLHALEEMLMKLVLFGLLGVLVAAWRLPPRTRRSPPGSLRVAVAIAAVLGLLASGFFESSQRWYDTHTPCITDALLGGVGAALGVLVASRVRANVSREPQASAKVPRSPAARG